MNLLERLDPGGPALMLAASSATIVAVAAVGAEVLARLLARRGAASRHEVYLVALTIVLASPALAVAVGRSGLVLVALPGDRPAPVPDLPGPSFEEPPAPARAVVQPGPMTGPMRVVDADPPPLPTPTPAGLREAEAPRPTWAAVRGGLVGIWTAGAIVLAVRLMLGLVAMTGLRRRARPIDAEPITGVLDDVRDAFGTRRLPPIVEVDSGLAGPVTAGIFRPSVVLPRGLADRIGAAGLRDVLVHEVAHALRRDGLVGLLQRVAALTFWPHPLVHRLNRRLSRAREEACDDVVLGRGDPGRYARTLLQLAEGIGAGRVGGVVGLFEAHWRLEDRVARVLDPGRPSMTRANRRWTLSASALLAMSAVAAAAVRPESAPQGPAKAVAPAKGAAGAEPEAVLRGTVVDEAGKPVAGAMVDRIEREFRGVGPVRTGADGGFILRPDRVGSSVEVRATADGGGRLGIFSTGPRDLAPGETIRIVLKPSRPLTVRVADAAGRPVAGAAVEIGTDYAAGAVDPGTTDAGGVARFRVPADAPVEEVLALKEGVGADYFSNLRDRPAIPIGPPPAEVALTLGGARTVTLRAVDSGSRPVAGVAFRLRSFTLSGRPFPLSGASRITEVTTDASGIARWGWVPKECAGNVRVYPGEDLDVETPPRLSFFQEGDVTLTARFRRKARLSGRVVRADGSPARGVTLRSVGLGKSGVGRGSDATTGEDGSYTMRVPPDRSYLIAVTGPDGAARPLTDTGIGEGESHGGLDFRLIGGTRLRGRVATRPGDLRWIIVNLLGEELPANQQAASGTKARLRLPIPATLDVQGRYEVRLGPGDYEVAAASHRERHAIHVDGTGEVVLDFLGDLIPPPTMLTGVVVEPAPGGGERPARASISLQSAEPNDVSARTRSDEAGRFSIRRPDVDVGLYVANLNGVAAVKVAKGVNEVKVVLAPGASASGRVVDASGKPYVGEGPSMAMIGGPDGLPRTSVISLSKFEAGGRYEFKVLYPGAEYKVFFALGRDSGATGVLPIKTFRAAGPGPIDLGEFTIPAGP